MNNIDKIVLIKKVLTSKRSIGTADRHDIIYDIVFGIHKTRADVDAALRTAEKICLGV
jgi:hypothetical protein